MFERADDILAPIERRWRRTITRADWDLVRRKAPGALTDDECLILKAFEGEDAYTAALSRRSVAQLGPPAAEPAAATKAAAASASPVVTLAMLKTIFDRYNALLVDRLQRERAPLVERIGVLEAAAGARDAETKALRDRLLELEADRAAAREPLP